MNEFSDNFRKKNWKSKSLASNRYRWKESSMKRNVDYKIDDRATRMIDPIISILCTSEWVCVCVWFVWVCVGVCAFIFWIRRPDHFHLIQFSIKKWQWNEIYDDLTTSNCKQNNIKLLQMEKRTAYVENFLSSVRVKCECMCVCACVCLFCMMCVGGIILYV